MRLDDGARRAAAAALLAAGMVLVGAIPRLAVTAGALPDVLRPFVWSDVVHTYERGLLGGLVPYWDTFFEYPPLIGYTSGAFSRLIGSAIGYVAAWTIVQAASAALVAWVLARTAGTRRTVIFWSLSPQLLLLGALNFDLIAVLAFVVAAVLARRARVVGASVAIAVGVIAKLYPLAALPVVLVARTPTRSTRRAIVAAAAAAGLVAACYAPAAAAPHGPLAGIGRYAVGIGANFDSVWGFAQVVLDQARVPDTATIVLAASSAGLVLTYALAVLPAALRARDIAAPMFLAVITVLLWSRLYSPQFSLWVLPAFALLALRPRTYVLLCVADVLVFASVYPITLTPPPRSEALVTVLPMVLAAGVVLRHVALVLAWREARTLSRVRSADASPATSR